MKLLQNYALQDLNWWKVGGAARYFCAPESEGELGEVLRWWKGTQWPIYIISGGSNVLVQDGLIDGFVLSLKSLAGVLLTTEIDGRLHIECLAGTPKSDLAKIFLHKKLAPAVFLTGIPGDVGGGVVMNAGVGEDRKPREFCEIVDWFEVIELEGLTLRRYQHNEVNWQYRHTVGWQPGVIVKVGVSWPLEPNSNLMNEVREATKKRVATQPLDQPSCGSVFRNPPGHKSAQLIQDCGLKGFTIGGAQVSTKHANFIVNRGGATAADVKAVIDHVRDQVLQKHNVDLQAEVRFIGQWN